MTNLTNFQDRFKFVEKTLHSTNQDQKYLMFSFKQVHVFNNSRFKLIVAYNEYAYV